jgi:hypothetical protein
MCCLTAQNTLPMTCPELQRLSRRVHRLCLRQAPGSILIGMFIRSSNQIACALPEGPLGDVIAHKGASREECGKVHQDLARPTHATSRAHCDPLRVTHPVGTPSTFNGQLEVGTAGQPACLLGWLRVTP